jgi:hypothetical protein
MSQQQEEDYLDEDKPFKKPIKHQKFCVISMLTPNCFPESKREDFKDQKVLGVKVRGAFETYEDAKERAKTLQQHDKYHNIFVGEIGKWLPFDVDISTLDTQDDPVYREKSLNSYMKAYKDCLEEDTQEQKQRKDSKLEGLSVVTGKTGLKDENNSEEVSNMANDSTTNEEEPLVETKSTVDDKINETMNEKEELQKQVNESNMELDSLKNQLDELKNMFADLK